MRNHYSVALEETAEGWFPGRCNCGWDGGDFPTAEDACDALMDHAYGEGAADAADLARKAV